MRKDCDAGLAEGAAQAAADTGAGRMLFDMSAADVLRRLSDAICAVDENEITCPLLVWLEGRHYNTHQTMHAINGLGEVLRTKGAIFDLGIRHDETLRDGQPVWAMSDEEIVKTFKELSLKDAKVCEKVEAHTA